MVSVFEDSLALKKRLPGTFLICFLRYFRQYAVVFSSKDKATIRNDYEEKSLTAHQICKEHKPKELVLGSIQRFLKRLKEDGSMERGTSSGWPITITNDENLS